MYPKYNLFHYSSNLRDGVTSCSTNALSIMNAFTNTDPETIEINSNSNKINVEDIIRPNRIYHILQKNTAVKYPHHICFVYFENEYYEFEAFLGLKKLEIRKCEKKYFISRMQLYIDGPQFENTITITIHSCKFDDHETVLKNIEKNVQEFLTSANDKNKDKYLRIHQKVQDLLD